MLDNNAAGRALKAVTLGKKSLLLADSYTGGELLGGAMTVIETAKLSSLIPKSTSPMSSAASKSMTRGGWMNCCHQSVRPPICECDRD